MDAGPEANEDEMGLLRESTSIPPLIPLTAEAIRSSSPNAYTYPMNPILTPGSSTYSYPMVVQRESTPSDAGYPAGYPASYPAGYPARSYPGLATGYPAQGYTYSAAPTSATYR